MRARAGLLAFGSSYSPRLPGPIGQGRSPGFAPRPRGGVAADSHRLPWALMGARALRLSTLAEFRGPVQASRARLLPAPKGSRDLNQTLRYSRGDRCTRWPTPAPRAPRRYRAPAARRADAQPSRSGSAAAARPDADRGER